MSSTNEWRQVLLADLAAPTRNALVGGPFGSDLVSADYTDSGVPVIRGENLSAGRWVSGAFVHVSEEKARKLAANTAGPLDVIFTQRGANHYRQVAVVPRDAAGRFVISQSQMKLTVDPTKVDPLFVYYLFQAPAQQQYLQRNAIQTGVPHTNLTILKKVPLKVPRLEKQQRIVAMLGSIDDKIELLQGMNETMEAMARAIFKDWFVDFGPTRAKMAGLPPYLADTVWRLFPDQLDASGTLPAGWARESVGQHAAFFNSKRIPLSSRDRATRPGRFPYHGAAGVVDHVDDYLFDGIFLLIGEDGSVVDKRGYAVTQYVSGQFWVNNHAHVIQGRLPTTTEQLYLHFAHQPVAAFVTGAVQPKLSMGRLQQVPFINAGPAIADALHALVGPLFSRVLENRREIETLTALRDLLLPKLMSGAVEVCDAERSVEATL